MWPGESRRSELAIEVLDKAAAVAEFDWVLKQEIPGRDLQKVHELRLRLVPPATSND